MCFVFYAEFFVGYETHCACLHMFCHTPEQDKSVSSFLACFRYLFIYQLFVVNGLSHIWSRKRFVGLCFIGGVVLCESKPGNTVERICRTTTCYSITVVSVCFFTKIFHTLKLILANSVCELEFGFFHVLSTWVTEHVWIPFIGLEALATNHLNDRQWERTSGIFAKFIRRQFGFIDMNYSGTRNSCV